MQGYSWTDQCRYSGRSRNAARNGCYKCLLPGNRQDQKDTCIGDFARLADVFISPTEADIHIHYKVRAERMPRSPGFLLPRKIQGEEGITWILL